MILKIAFPYEDVCFGVPAGNLSLIKTLEADVTSSEASMTQIKESIKVKRASDVSFYLIKAVVLTVNDERTDHL